MRCDPAGDAGPRSDPLHRSLLLATRFLAGFFLPLPAEAVVRDGDAFSMDVEPARLCVLLPAERRDPAACEGLRLDTAASLKASRASGTATTKCAPCSR